MQPTAPPKACVIPVCGNLKFNLVHKFPADPARFSEWIEVISKDKPIVKLKGLNQDAIRKRFFVCARHFGVNNYKNSESRCLNTTSVPSLNLVDLSELHQSKAWMIENSIAEPSPEEQPTVQSQTVRILNSGLTSRPSVNQIVKRVTNVVKAPELETEPIFSVDPDLALSFDEPQSKKLKLQTSPATTTGTNLVQKQSISGNFTPITKAAASPKLQSPVKKLVKPERFLPKSEKESNNVTSEVVEETKPTNKLLALIELTPSMYEKLSSCLASERSENVESLINFIDKPSDDLETADNGKNFIIT